MSTIDREQLCPKQWAAYHCHCWLDGEQCCECGQVRGEEEMTANNITDERLAELERFFTPRHGVTVAQSSIKGDDVRGLIARLRRAEGERDEAREALKPFALYADAHRQLTTIHPHGDTVSLGYWARDHRDWYRSFVPVLKLKLADFDKARAALEETGGGNA